MTLPTFAQEAMLDSTLDPNFGEVALAPGMNPDPYIATVTSGGDVDASTLNLGEDCQGFVTSTPDYHVDLTGEVSRLRIFFVGEGDATLVVSTPDGTWLCNDDASGTVNPMVEVTNAPAGPYDIWVGSFQSGAAISGTLYITELDYDPANLPPA
jgi:serine protease Do